MSHMCLQTVEGYIWFVIKKLYILKKKKEG